ncbi:MAG: clostripain-related cysteine peptidase [Dehalococcoidia bacterium]
MKINVRGKIAILSLAIAIVVSIIASGHPSITSVVDSSSIIYSSNLESSSYWNRYDGLHIGDQVTKEEDIESTTGSEIETVNSIGNASPTATAIADIPVIVEDLGGKHSIAAIKHSLYTDNAVELERARTQYGEYYELSDGRMAALLSTAPIHYETSKGTYQLIDDNIIPDNIQNDYAFTNAASSFSVHFPGTAEWTTDVLFHSQTGTEMHLGSQSEVWYKSAIGEDELLYQSHNSVAVTEGNTISYPERYPYVTEVFTIKPQGIKHNYIMNQAASFMDDHIGGTIEFQEVVTLPAESYLSVDGEVQTYDFVTDHDIHVVDASGSSFAIFPAPWAHEGTSRSFDPEVDSWLSLSYRVTYLAECVVQIAVCVPLDWLTEPERSYPVTIDPSIYCYENHSYDDCYAIGSDQFYYSTEYLKVGYRSDYGLPYYLTQMTWHNVNIPPGSTIDYVRLSYVPYDDYSNTCSFRLQFEAADDALPCAYQYPAERDYVSHSTLFSPYSTVWTQGQRRSFTGFVAGLQEVIDRPGWESGNNVAMRWCAYTASGGYRQIYSYDYSSSYAPYLYVEYTPRFDEPWLEQSGCYVSPNSVANGGQLTVYYRIYNPNSDDLPVALGCSIRKNGTDTWVSDPPHDKSVTATPDYSDHYRYFDVPCDAELGSYDVAWGLWETIPGTPWDYLGKTNQFTIVEQAYSVYGVISDFVGDADQDGDGYYETYDFLIGIDGDVSTDCATNVYGKMICTTTGQSWGSASSWAISGTTTDYHYFAFDETDFAGEISENTDLDFTVELWNQSKTIKLATDTSVLGEPVKVDYLGKQQTRIVGDRFVHKTAKIGIPLLLEAHLQNYDWWIWWNLAGQTVHFDIYYSGQWHEIDDDGISETSFVTDGDGIASVYYTAPKALSPGDYLIRARYDGSSSYEPCELERTIEIKKPNWLYMIYMCGDNDLDEAYVSSFYNDIAKIDVNNEVSVVVLFDRPDNTPHNPVWTTGHYFRISDDALIINDWGEINMGSGTVLDTFITTTLDTCDAYNKALVFKNHGSGWVEDIHIAIEHGDLIREELYQHVMPPEFESLPPDNGVWEGVIYDDDDGTNNRDNLQLFEIRQALNGHGEFGLIAYHACVMGTVEVIYDLLTYTELVVVSEDNTFSSGWKYGDHLSTSVLTSSTSPLQLTQTMVDVCTQNTLGGWDLANSNIASLNTEISSFADRLIDLLPEPGIMTSINTARINARKFRAFGGGAEIYVDLRQFALGIATLIPDTTLQTRANAVANRLSTSTFRRCWKTSYEATLGGLSIYFPPNDGGNEYDYYFTNGVLTFTTNPAQHWDDFLDLYFDAIDPMCQIIAPNSGGWYKNDISVAATASDENGVKYVEFQYSIDQSNWYALPGPDSADGRDWYGDNGWELTFRTTDTIHGVIDDSSVWVRARACDNAGNIGLWDECDVSFGVDNTEPLVEFFDVIPGSVILGNGFTIGYIVSDILGSGLKQTELWRANDVNGLPDWDGTENPIDTHYFVGIDSTTGSFYDIPDSVGLYWYGIHVVDDAGNWVPEDSPIQVCVGVTEVCNGIDDDCDGLVDDDDPDCTGQATWYLDGDSDGYGDPNTTTQACSQPAGYVDNDADCNDSNENVNPAATEVCNGIDDDCDGLVDDDDPDCTGQATWYLDGDSDGYGDPNTTTHACSQPAGYVDNNADCDDSNENVNPAATEVCNGIDDDCDGLVDEGCDNEVYLDSQSSHTSFCCMVDVEIWGNTTDSFLAGQMNLAYDPTCGNVTDFVPNLTDFMLMDWNLDTPGEALITFLAPEEMSGEYLIGTLSIHGLCEHEDCFTTLDFVDAESDLTDKAGSPIPVNWIDGTFECGGVCGDVNNDDHVNVLDMVLIGQYFGQTGSSGWIPEDVKKDGVINVLDMIIIGQHWTG